MVNYELHINGVLCDLDPEEQITLVYESPIFAELDAITSNRSYTIQLPLTRNNNRAIGIANRIDADSEQPFKKLPAELYVDGVPLISSGFAVIDEITEDGVSCTLTWGNVDAFQSLFDTELEELDDALQEQGDNVISWDDSTDWETTSDGGGVQYVRSDFGVGVVNPTAAAAFPGQYVSSIQYARPSVSVLSILSAIQQKSGISILWGELPIDNLWVPITGNNGDNKYHDILVEGTLYKGKALGVNVFCPLFSQFHSNSKNEIVNNGPDDLSISVRSEDAVNLLIEGNDDGYIIINYANDADYPPVFRIYSNKNAVLYEAQGVNSAGYGETWRIPNIYLSLDTRDVDSIWFSLRSASSSVIQDFSATLKMRGEKTDRGLNYPTVIPVAKNLPSMSCGEFVQNLMNMFGVFGMVAGGSRIQFISASTLYDNIEEGIFKDWSKRLLMNKAKDPAGANAIRFHIDGWAQKNTLDYDNDSDVEATTAGEIRISNRNIDREQEMNLNFSASDNKFELVWGGSDGNKASVAFIPLYEKNDSGEIQSKGGTKTRILRRDENEGYSFLYFPEDLSFGGSEGLVARYYGDLEQILQNAKIVSVSMLLSTIDVMDLDWGIPIWLSQYCAYFALYRITVGENGLSDVELIKL